MVHKFSFAVALGLSLAPALSQAQTITPLTHPSPGGSDIAFQLTDGTVMAQSNSNNSQWYRLTPDKSGSYVNGTWAQAATLPSGYSPYAFASAVLADGRLVVAGGEYNFNNFDLTNKCAVYDPVANTWTPLAAPKDWDYIGDSPSVVLADGRYLIGNKINKKMAALDPATLTWETFASTGKADFNAEEGWTLLSDGTFITDDVKNAPLTEIYSPVTQQWHGAGNTPQPLNGPPCCKSIDYGGKKPYHPPGEIGPMLLMPDGTVFATGSMAKGETAAHNAVLKNGIWTAAPDFPNGDEAGDSFAALLPNGHALVEGVSGRLYEFDGVTLTAESQNASGNSLMVLPTGEVLIGGSAVYSSKGKPKSPWAPTIATSPSTVTRGTTYAITGTQFNGLSQANSFGDELETATNYPLVRITNNATGHVFYARTHDHSTMGVATGSTTVSTNFEASAATETGASTLVVVANGIASKPVSLTVN